MAVTVGLTSPTSTNITDCVYPAGFPMIAKPSQLVQDGSTCICKTALPFSSYPVHSVIISAAVMSFIVLYVLS